MKISKTTISIIAIIPASVLALTLVIGTDTDWGKGCVEKMILSSADGDVVNAMLYKPKTATAENPAPAYCMHTVWPSSR